MNFYGRTALHYAIDCNLVGILEPLLDRGASFDFISPQRKAILKGCKPAVSQLLRDRSYDM
jgi:ankyrin repeat protein